MRLRLRCQDREVIVDEHHSSITIGRAEDNDVVVKGNLISRLHARIEINRNKFVLIDQSTNGTFVQTADGEESFVRRDSLQIKGAGHDRPGSPARAGLPADDPLRLRRDLRAHRPRVSSAEPALRVVKLREHRRRQPVAVSAEVLADLGHFLAPQPGIHRQQCIAAQRRPGSTLRYCRSCGARQPADRRLAAPRLAGAALQHPGQHAQILAVARPEELALRIAPEPVHVVDAGRAGLSLAPTFSQCCQ